MNEQLRAQIRKFDEMTPNPMNLRQILQVSTSSETIQQLNEFLRQEFSIRCAERICMLEESNFPIDGSIPELQSLYRKHVESLMQMIQYNRSFSASKKQNGSDPTFLPVVRDIVERGQNTVPLLCRGMARLLQTTTDSSHTEASVNTFMNEFLLNRIGSNVLMSQYLAVATGDDPPHPTSIIDPHCNVTRICQETARSVQTACYNETKFRPVIKVKSYADDSLDENFAFIPPVISYITQELLKNSAVATARLRSSSLLKKKKISADDLAINVVISADPSRVMIHIGDTAGGIPFEATQHIWSFLYSTKRRGHEQEAADHDGDASQASSLEDAGATEMGGYGVGLPLSRLYANYLGGTINLISLPGYGTHAYVALPRLPETMVESVPVRGTGWQAKTSCDTHFIL